jgi:Zn-dependent protease with chaperone function
VPPPQPVSRRLLDFAKANPRLIPIVLAVPFFLADHLPGEWYAEMTPHSAAVRLEQRALEKLQRQTCDDMSGQAALDALIRKLAHPSAGPVEAIAVNEHSFMVSGRPGGQLLAFRSAIVEVDADVLAALVAHELAHIEAGATLRAAGRGEGGKYLLRLAMPWWEDRPAELTYSRAEERAADDAAMAKLFDAGISLRPAADFFARIDQANKGDRYWAQDYSEQHGGISNRATVWRTASNNQGATHPTLSERQADDLFNICWERPADVATKWSQVSI